MHSNTHALHVTDSVSNIQNHPKLVELRLQFSDTYQNYLNAMKSGLDQLNLNEKYNTIMDSARNSLTSQLSNVMQTEDLQHLISLSNSAYQEVQMWILLFEKL